MMEVSFEFGRMYLRIDIEQGGLRIRISERGEQITELYTKHDDEVQRLIESIGIVLRSRETDE